MNDAPTLRADAQRNRERILAAAEEVFLEKGAGASLDDVAKRAGVGIGTLYRRFPTREELLAASYSARFLEFAETSRLRGDRLETLDAVRTYLEELVQHTTVYRGLAASLGTVLQVGTPGCLASTEQGIRLLERGYRDGTIRSDVSFDDLVCIATAVSLAVEKEASPQARITHLADVFLGGIIARPGD